MSKDPYAPPSAPLRDLQPQAPGATWKALILGVLTDLLGTALSSFALVTVIGMMMLSHGATREDIDASLRSTGYMVIGMALGLGCSVLGGYVAARVANQREYFHALLTGVIVLVAGEILLSLSQETAELAYRIIGDLLVVPAAVFGGHLRKTATRAAA